MKAYKHWYIHTTKEGDGSAGTSTQTTFNSTGAGNGGGEETMAWASKALW